MDALLASCEARRGEGRSPLAAPLVGEPFDWRLAPSIEPTFIVQRLLRLGDEGAPGSSSEELEVVVGIGPPREAPGGGPSRIICERVRLLRRSGKAAAPTSGEDSLSDPSAGMDSVIGDRAISLL